MRYLQRRRIRHLTRQISQRLPIKIDLPQSPLLLTSFRRCNDETVEPRRALPAAALKTPCTFGSGSTRCAVIKRNGLTSQVLAIISIVRTILLDTKTHSWSLIGGPRTFTSTIGGGSTALRAMYIVSQASSPRKQRTSRPLTISRTLLFVLSGNQRLLWLLPEFERCSVAVTHGDQPAVRATCTGAAGADSFASYLSNTGYGLLRCVS